MRSQYLEQNTVFGIMDLFKIKKKTAILYCTIVLSGLKLLIGLETLFINELIFPLIPFCFN